MRKYLIYLILIMFVGLHVISDLTPHFHDQADNIVTADINLFDQATTENTGRILAIAQITNLPGDDDCCSKAASLKPDSDIHCVADCGLAANEFAAYHPNPRLYLAPPNDPAANTNSINDLFRPPIA